MAPLSHRGYGVFIPKLSYFFVDLLGFNESVFPGVSLLSRRRRSGFPVESAIGFGPGLRAITLSFSVLEDTPLTGCMGFT